MSRDYFSLVVDNSNFSTCFFLVPSGIDKVEWKDRGRYQRLDPEQCYDIELPDGRKFTGCEIRIRTQNHEGRGGMDESYSFSEAFFFVDGLEIKMPEGTRLKPNIIMTKLRNIRARKERQEKTRRDLLAEREKIDRQLNELE